MCRIVPARTLVSHGVSGEPFAADLHYAGERDNAAQQPSLSSAAYPTMNSDRGSGISTGNSDRLTRGQNHCIPLWD